MLSIVKKDENKIKIERCNDYDEILAAAEDIADVLDIEIVTKSHGYGSLINAK
ncbi:hypothetical protein CHISP_1193 [Chitinispirillum alkaliphilum]|nr:hypothetical protein CHISP_1193 [Chitinispirillum alkaliphilum]